MPGIVLELALAKIKQADLKEFKEKILPQEQAMEARIISEGNKTMSMLVDEAKNATDPRVDLNFMDEEEPKPKPIEDEGPPKSGAEMMKNFLEKLNA